MMNITEEKPASKWVVYGGILWFAVMGLPSIYVSINSFINLLTDAYTLPEAISINKGSYYLFGAGLGLLIFVMIGIYSKILNKEISPAMNQLLVCLLVGSVAVALILPHLIHYVAADYLEGLNYQVCEARSTRWLHNVTIVYTKSLPCDEN